MTLHTDSGVISVVISVSSILEHTSLSGLLMVSFEEIYGGAAPVQTLSKPTSPPPTKTLEEMRKELAWTKENLQTTIEEMEAANEELKSTNEELQSTNEELQSTNEELETSKEELQSLNEESVTVNSELQNRMEDYQIANDDLKNLFDSTQLATIFLDTQLCIRRFTPKVKEIISLVATDIGRPIAHFSCSLQAIDLSETSRQVLKTLDKYEAEIYDTNGRCFFTRILPYRTTNNVIDGTVLSFEDISARKKVELALIDSEKRYKNLFDYSPIAIWEEDCSSLEQALFKLREQGISDLGDYLAKNPEESLRLFKSRRILAVNNAALSLFNVLNKEELPIKLPQLLRDDATQLLLLQLQAIWNQQEKVNLAFNYTDLSGNVLALSLTWTITSDHQGKLNYANIITTVLPQNQEAL